MFLRPEGTRKGASRQNFKKGGGFRSQHKMEKRPDRFTLLTKTPKEILALEKRKFKTPPPMTTPVEKRNANKFCGRETIAHNSGAEAKQRKRTAEKEKEVENPPEKRHTSSNFNDSVTAKYSKTEITQSFSPPRNITSASWANG
ncbi:hypothetical protein Tco_0799932 [Tanacetum coccineum]|uniref:Uncharacterized protein n=1 Tax=Tanacetum coccineum TaxID=301880 RepID=A0ABQ4ZRP5_9ASTR